MKFVYAIYNTKTKCYMTSGGYYGNECYIRSFESKRACEKHLETYLDKSYRPKRLRVE